MKNNTSNNFLNSNTNISTFISSEQELKNIKKYIDIIFNGTLIDKDYIFYQSINPKISVIITVYNGEAYLKTALLSVQNQDFKDIEIIMIDDCSQDNSVHLIRELMNKDHRIILWKNKKNRGMLYTKTKGILLAKGKYILLLDEDDIYGQRDMFSTLYDEAEKNNLDIINFRWLGSSPKLKNIVYEKRREEFPIIFQPELGQLTFQHTSSGHIIQKGGLLTTLFIKRNILFKIIKEIDEKYLNEKINSHDDLMLHFLLTRNAFNYKKIDRLFYIVLAGWNISDKKIKYRIIEKSKNSKYMRCNSVLNFIEFSLNKTNNTFYDKKIAFYSLDKWLLNYWCRNYSETINKAINISEQFLRNKYIQETDKEKIRLFLKETKIKNNSNFFVI